jgi:hypothetical protein
MPPGVLQPVLFLFGIGFLAANVKVVADLLRYQWRKRSALLIWEGRKPRFYGFSLGLGVVLGLLFAFKLVVQHRPPAQLFGEAMMFVYYGYTFPLSTRISRGFYRDGVWADSGFLPWGEISAVSWKEDGGVTLVLISHLRSIARHLDVPGPLYGEARRLLRERVKARDLHIRGAGLDLGSRDEQDAV